MKTVKWIVFLLIIALSSCATNYYAFDDDFNGKDFDGEFSEEELLLKEQMMADSILVETFNAERPQKGFGGFAPGSITGGELRSEFANGQVGQTIDYSHPEGFESVTVCWKRTSPKGHLILWARIPGFGMPTFFNDVNGTSAHIHLDSLNGDTEFLGRNSSAASSSFVTQEVRVAGDEIQLYRNGVLFTTYKMDKARKIESFSIGNNDGGAGVIDYIIVK